MSAEPRPWSLERPGAPLRVWELGSDGDAAAGPPVLCLHGWLDHGLAFARMAAGRRGRWLALDLRGFGGSPLPPSSFPYFPDYLADVDALVEHLGEPVDLVGHSMGGTVAAMYAGARPERVRRLVVLDGLAALATSERSALERTRCFLAGLRRPPRPGRLRSVEDAARRLVERHPGLDPGHARLLAERGTRPAEEGGVRWSFDPLHLVRSPLPSHEEDLAEFLAAIRAPSLLVWARPSIYPAELRARRAALVRDRVEVELDGGHMIPYVRPREAGDLVDRWRAGHPVA